MSSTSYTKNHKHREALKSRTDSARLGGLPRCLSPAALSSSDLGSRLYSAPMVAANPQPTFPRVRRTGQSTATPMIFDDILTDLCALRDTCPDCPDSGLPDARSKLKACAGSRSPERRLSLDDELLSRDRKRRALSMEGRPVPALQLSWELTQQQSRSLHSASSLPCDDVSPHNPPLPAIPRPFP